MPTTPPSDGNPETPASPYGPKPTTPDGSETAPPVVPAEPVPPVEAAPSPPPPPVEATPSPRAPLAAEPSPTQPPPPEPYGVAPPAPPGSVPFSPYQGVQPAPYGVQVPPPYYSGPPKPSTTLSLLSMIFGIASVPFSCCWGFGFLLAVAGIVLGHLARKREVANGMAKAGLIISYIVAGLSLAVFLIFVASALISGLTRY